MSKLKIILRNIKLKIQLTTFLLFFFLFNAIGQLFPIPGGWINDKGDVLAFDADTTYFSGNGFVRYKQGGKVRFTKLAEITYQSNEYDELTDFNNGVAMAKIDGHWWVIDTAEQKIKEVACHYAYGFYDGLARIQLGNRFGFVNEKGDVIIPVKYFGAYDFSEGRARVYINGHWGVINNKGQFIVKPVYDYLWDYREGMTCAMKQKDTKELWGYLNTDGVEVIEMKYDYAFPFSDGLAIVRWGDLFKNDLRFIDQSGKVKYKIPYKDIYPFSEGLACFYESGKWGYINQNFEVAIAPRFDSPSSFKGGLALVTVDGKLMYIDHAGTVVWQNP